MRNFCRLGLALCFVVGLCAKQVHADDWETEDRGREGSVVDTREGGNVNDPWGTGGVTSGSRTTSGGSGSASGGTRGRSGGATSGSRSSSSSRSTRSSGGRRTTSKPRTGISDPSHLTLNIFGKDLSNAWYKGFIVTGSVGGDGQPGRWVYFRRVIAWHGYSTNSSNVVDAGTVTFGPEEWVYYP